MTDTTPRAGAPLLGAAQAQKHVTHNDALYQFDAFLCTRLLDRDLSTPPSSPADGDTYLVKATGAGTWTGQDGKIAYSADGAWRFYAPFAGLVAFVSDESVLIVFDGTNWVSYASLIALQNVPMLGVNTTADSTSKLSVQSNAALFSDVPTGAGGSGDMRVALSKQASGNTASLLLQDNLSGRAEIGLSGDDDLHVKVSSDGAAWTDALCVPASSGQVQLLKGQLKFPATANPSTDANTLDDYREGTWTPTVSFNTAGTSSFSYATQTGTYIKIGRKVHLEVQITFTPTIGTGSGGLKIGGLPFTANSIFAASGVRQLSSNFSWPSGYTGPNIGFWDTNNLTVYVHKTGAGSTTFDATSVTNGVPHTILGSIDYFAAA